MSGKAVRIELDACEAAIVQKILNSRTFGCDLQSRARIVLAASEGLPSIEIQRQYGIEEHRAALWRNRFYQTHEHWKQLDPTLRPKMNEKLICLWLSNRAGRGRKPQITPEQKAMIIAVACESPTQSGYPHTHWTVRLLAQEVIKRGIVEYIAFQTVGSFLKGVRTKTAQKQILFEGSRKRERSGKI